MTAMQQSSLTFVQFVTAIVLWPMLTSGQAVAQLTFQKKPIEYSKTQATDPVAKLLRDLESNQTHLKSKTARGYLSSVLQALDVPVASQTLVFSKTSLQKHLISPRNPRAVYFNDDVYVAWVPEGPMIEIASVDPLLGTVFYVVDQAGGRHPGEIRRENNRCLFCHASSDTGRIPGLLMHSVYTDPDGKRVFSADAIPPDSAGPLQGRWAGWFVSGRHGRQRHLGNLMINAGQRVTVDDTDASANVVDLSKWFDIEKYPTPHSDIVALLVLRHQVTVHNVLIDANHQARVRLYRDAEEVQLSNEKARKAAAKQTAEFIDAVAEQVVDGLLMVGEAEFSDSIKGTSDFASQFVSRGPADSQGRSLRELDLAKSLFKYPCSYLIYTESFDALPKSLMKRIKKRLLAVLESKDTRGKYAHLTADKKTAILEILTATKKELINRS